jgi:flagellar biosynthesis protein FlhF
MHIQHFSGATMAEAIAGVREALGPDAFILSTKTHRGKHGARVEITAAPEAAVSKPSTAGSRQPTPASQSQDLSSIRSLVAPLEEELKELARTVRGAARSGDSALADEIAALRAITEKLIAERMPREGESAAAALESVGIDTEIARERAPRLTELFKTHGSPRAAVRSLLAEILEAVCAPPRMTGARREVFVGPGGSGKTTSLAKLAGMRLRSAPRRLGAKPGRHVAIVACDTRDGYDSALRAYCFRNALPFRSVRNLTDLRVALREMGRRHIFVEVAEEVLRELPAESLREALGKHVRVHLVASAIARRAELLAELEPFANLRPDSLLLTRVDVLAAWNEVANLLLSNRVPPLMWLGDGPDPYKALELADPEAIVERVLGNA